MRIVNKTAYNTRALRKILTAVHAEVARHRGRLPQWKRAECFVVYRRTRYGTNAGWAYRGGSRMCLQLARPHHHIRTNNVAVIAWHEVLHLYGFAEKDMPKTFTPDNRARWLFIDREVGEYLPVTPAQPRAKVDRGHRARVLLARWERRARLAAGKVKVYRRKVKYYNRREVVPDEVAGGVGHSESTP